MEHHGTIKLYHLFLLGSSNIRVVSASAQFPWTWTTLQPASTGHNWSGLRVHWVHPWTSHPLQRWDRWEWSGGGFTEDHVAFSGSRTRSCPETFWGKMPMFWTFCIIFNFILHSFLFMFLSFSAAIYQTYRSSKGDMLKPASGYPPKRSRFFIFCSLFVIVLLSFWRPVQVTMFGVHEHVHVQAR